MHLNPKIVPAVLIFLALTGFNEVLAAQPLYHFVRIDKPSLVLVHDIDGSGSFGPSLNDAGSVAFGGLDLQGRQGIFSGNGTESELDDFRPIAIRPEVNPYSIGSYIGTRVAFGATVNNKMGFFNSDGIRLETITLDPSIRNPTSKLPLMNGSRQMAYIGGDFNAGQGGLYLAQNGGSQPVYLVPLTLPRGVLSFRGAFEFQLTPIRIDDAGGIFFEGVFFCLENIPPRLTTGCPEAAAPFVVVVKIKTQIKLCLQTP